MKFQKKGKDLIFKMNLKRNELRKKCDQTYYEMSEKIKPHVSKFMYQKISAFIADTVLDVKDEKALEAAKHKVKEYIYNEIGKIYENL